jgi:hypothetical protein
MATKKVSKARATKATPAAARRAAQQRMDASIAQAARQAGLSPRATTSAVIGYYLLIDFGFTAGVPFQPNSVQFYSTSGAFLCYKVVDNASLVSLVPILNCHTVQVTWNTSTSEAVHIYGKQP